MTTTNREVALAYERKRAKEFREWIGSLKAAQGCVCGEKDPRCLDFHHRDPETKEMTISDMITMRKEKILAELEKCDVLCANCHRKIHAIIL